MTHLKQLKSFSLLCAEIRHLLLQRYIVVARHLVRLLLHDFIEIISRLRPLGRKLLSPGDEIVTKHGLDVQQLRGLFVDREHVSNPFL